MMTKSSTPANPGRTLRRAKLIAALGIVTLISGLGLAWRAQSMGEASFGKYVQGVGMVIIMAEDQPTLEAWYADNIGIDVGFVFAEFLSRDLEDPEKVRTLLWGVAPRDDSEIFPAGGGPVLIGYEVVDLDGLVSELTEKGIEPAMQRYYDEDMSLAYYRDPENNLVGLIEYYEERREPIGAAAPEDNQAAGEEPEDEG